MMVSLGGCTSVTRIYSNIRIFEYQAPNIRYSNTNTQFSGFEYIRYSYSVGFPRPNIFDIRIRSGCQKRIYSIFVFGKLSDYEYIRYSYLVRKICEYIRIPVQSKINNYATLANRQLYKAILLNLSQLPKTVKDNYIRLSQPTILDQLNELSKIFLNNNLKIYKTILNYDRQLSQTILDNYCRQVSQTI